MLLVRPRDSLHGRIKDERIARSTVSPTVLLLRYPTNKRTARFPVRSKTVLPSMLLNAAIVVLTPIQTLPQNLRDSAGREVFTKDKLPNPPKVPAKFPLVPRTLLPGHANHSWATTGMSPTSPLPSIDIEERRATVGMPTNDPLSAVKDQSRIIIFLLSTEALSGFTYRAGQILSVTQKSYARNTHRSRQATRRVLTTSPLPVVSLGMGQAVPVTQTGRAHPSRHLRRTIRAMLPTPHLSVVSLYSLVGHRVGANQDHLARNLSSEQWATVGLLTMQGLPVASPLLRPCRYCHPFGSCRIKLK